MILADDSIFLFLPFFSSLPATTPACGGWRSGTSACQAIGSRCFFSNLDWLSRLPLWRLHLDDAFFRCLRPRDSPPSPPQGFFLSLPRPVCGSLLSAERVHRFAQLAQLYAPYLAAMRWVRSNPAVTPDHKTFFVLSSTFLIPPLFRAPFHPRSISAHLQPPPSPAMDRELRRLRQEAAIAGRYDAGVVTRRARAGAAARRQEAVIARKLDEHHANLEVRRVNVETNAKMKLEAQRLRMEKEHVRLRRQELDAEFEHEERLADARAHPGRALERKHQARLEQERRAAREASARRAEGEAKVAEERRRTAALRTSEAKAKERATLAEARRLEAERALAEDKRVADAERQARDRARFDKLKAKFKTLEGRATALLGPIKEREAELQKRTAWVKNAVHKGPHTVARDSRHWQPDREVNACCRCDVGFGLLFFRHHCRFCGHLMCSECAPERPWMRDAARVCEDCLLEIGRQWEAAGLRHSEVNAIFSDRQLPSQELAAKASEARKTIDRYMEAARDEIRHLVRDLGKGGRNRRAVWVGGREGGGG